MFAAADVKTVDCAACVDCVDRRKNISGASRVNCVDASGETAEKNASTEAAQPDDSGENQRDADRFRERNRRAEENDVQNRRADDSDSGPNRVRDAHRERFHRRREEPNAAEHRRKRRQRRPKSGKTARVLHADRPSALEEAGDKEQNPIHRQKVDFCLV